jgi:hypothetical protein
MNINSSKEYLIIEISTNGSYDDSKMIKKLLNKDEFFAFYTNGNDKEETDNVNDYNFVFLSQELSGLELVDLLQNITNHNKSRIILCVVHNTGHDHLGIINNFNEKMKIETFSHSPHEDIWDKGLKPLFEAIGCQEKYNEQFKKLCSLIAPMAKAAIALRAQMLTPLVALDWIEQMSNTKNDFKISDQEAINDVKQDAIKTFRESISVKQHSHEYMFTGELFEKIKKYVLEKAGAIVHKDLKDFASAIEAHIERMQQ